ncbi:MAG TPA: glycosyltransferase family 2 protein [Candidatus Acidoferrales bacterium]|jgi:glycosyltransferase involved in cell wall biosynthesis|nr:glycosyltransferase family 2 protein [Candidatus Acidoferrales bacterium]
MYYFHWIAGTILALAWFSRIVDAALGMPSVADISQPEWDRRSTGDSVNRRVSIIVPARNEEEDIELSLTRLLELDYDNYEVIAVNDRSTDRTGEIMERVAENPVLTSGRLRVIHHRELPAGWLGKTHAMWTATNEATGDWLLFTDADVLFKPDSVRRAIAYAEAKKADHVVLFPRIIMKQPGEYMMIAFFHTMFVFGHRPWKVADPKSQDHMGVGAFNLIRQSVYEAVGTYKALRMEVIDDMKLGKVVKNAGYAQRNVFGGDLISLRWANGAMGVVNNLTKNFFAILSFQWPRTLISAFGLAFLNLMPFLGVWLAHGWARLPYVVALGSMFSIYLGMSLRSGVPAYYFLLHPVSTALFIYTLLRSMFHALWNDGIIWRGTRYPLEELRKGMV